MDVFSAVMACYILFASAFAIIFARNFQQKIKQHEIYRFSEFWQEYRFSVITAFGVVSFGITFPIASIVLFVLGVVIVFLLYRTKFQSFLTKLESEEDSHDGL